jgi:iron complex outermembrane receptor protein
VEDASSLRIDNTTFGYNFSEIPGIDRLRIFGRVSNAFVITGYSGSDPEVYSAGQGIDNQVYPRSRTFTGGVNVQL